MDLRRLDALVAEKVMGLEVIDEVEGYWYCPNCGEWVHGQQVTFSEHHTRCRQPVANDWPCDSEGTPHPCYSSDISAAWQVVEKMLGSDERDRFAEVVAKEAGFWTEESPEQNVLDLLEWLKDPENACLAVLKVKGVEVPEE